MTIPVGIATYFLLPDTPFTTRAWYLSKREREFAEERVRKAGKAAPANINMETFKRILSSWKWYAFVLGYVVRPFHFPFFKAEDTAWLIHAIAIRIIMR
jgi:ACS family pantothenate transporter-like MFS transporter